MSEHEAKVSISPENIQAIKEKYNLDETALKDVLGNVEVIAPMETRAPPARLPKEPDGDLSGETQLMRQLSRGDLSMAEVLMYMDLQDRKDRRERRDRREEERENNGNHTLTADDIGARTAGYLVAALKKEGVLGKGVNTAEEKPEWVKKIEQDNADILGKLRVDEEDKKLSAAIKEATSPLKTQLEKTEEKLAALSKPAPEGTGPPKSVIDQYIEGRDKLKAAGILPEEKKGSMYMIGADGEPIQGIPVKGEIPALAVYGPLLVKQVMDTVEAAADRIGKKYGFIEGEPTGVPPKPKESLIKMPLKPAAKPEPPTETPAKEVTPIEPVKPAEPIIVMPEKTIPEAVEEVAEEPVDLEAEILGNQNIPCAQCGVVKELLPNGLCKECATELAKEIKEHKKPIQPFSTSSQEVYTESLTVGKDPEVTVMPGIVAEIPEEAFTIEGKPEASAPTKTRKKTKKAKKPKKKKEKKTGEQTTNNSK